MLAGLIVLALGMGFLIGLFTRSRLHAVSDAYKTSLDVLNRTRRRDLSVRAAAPHDAGLHR